MSRPVVAKRPRHTEDLEPADDAIDARAAAHLLRRTGFGASPAEVERVVGEGLGRAVLRIVLERDPGPAIFDLDRVQDAAAAAGIESLQAWWVARMLRSHAPFQEKLALFWHGHFATSFDRVQEPALMLRHLRLFLDLGCGPFRPLLGAVAEDPAMLLWLDAEKNRRGQPNENFARELFELFTLGIGAYTEQDIQQAARAFTGWRRAAGSFQLVDALHDHGEKKVLGRKGDLSAADVLDLAAGHRATARHLAGRALRFFATPQQVAPVIDACAATLAGNGLDVSRMLAAVFRSRWFFSETVVGARILSPAEFVIGHARTLEIKVNTGAAAAALATLGQSLLRPPSVKGWDGEEAWIHSVSAIARLNIAVRFTEGPDGGLAREPFTSGALIAARGAPRDAAEDIAELLLRRSIDPTVLDAIASHAERAPRAERVAAITRAVLTLPEASTG